MDVQGADHDCVFNYLGSSGGMKCDGLLMLFKKLYKERSGKVHYETVITGDDTKLRRYLSHLWYKGKGTKNHGGSLPIDIPESQRFADSTHHAKCVARVFFEMVKGLASPTRAIKLDTLRMKKYYGYFIK